MSSQMSQNFKINIQEIQKLFVSFMYNQDLNPKFRRSFKDVVFSNESKFQNQYSRNTIIIITIIIKEEEKSKKIVRFFRI